jgi:hypothetical protein
MCDVDGKDFRETESFCAIGMGPSSTGQVVACALRVYGILLKRCQGSETPEQALERLIKSGYEAHKERIQLRAQLRAAEGAK